MKKRRLLTAALTAAILLAMPHCVHASAMIKDTASQTESTEFRFRGYIGGMMLHSGYIFSRPFGIYSTAALPLGTMQIRGAAFGIGGHVKFAFGTPTDMLRIGAEGHSSNVNYTPSPSDAHTGWGGILVDYIRRTKGRVHPFVGCVIGGGGVKNHIIAEGSTDDFVTEPQAAMHKYAFMAIAPFLGIEVSLTPKLSLVLKTDWLLNATGPQNDFSNGPRLYVGMLFNRLQH